MYSKVSRVIYVTRELRDLEKVRQRRRSVGERRTKRSLEDESVSRYRVRTLPPFVLFIKEKVNTSHKRS